MSASGIISRRAGRRPGAGQQAAALTGRDYLSHSQVAAYQSCPLKWWCGYVAEAKPEFTSAALLLGSSIHRAIQHHLEALIACDRLPSLDALMDVFHDHWQEDGKRAPIRFPEGCNNETMAKTGRQMLEQFVNSPYAKPAGEILGIEETLRIRLADDLPDLLTKVDLIEHRDGDLVVTDFKTSRGMWNDANVEEHASQLVLYGQATHAIARELNARTRLQFVVITKTKVPKIHLCGVPFDSDRVERTKVVIRRVFRAMQAGLVYPAPSMMGCSGCPYQGRCGQWHKEVSR